MSQVSCIIPYYNGAETIVRAIDSVIFDTHCLEVIVVSDASQEPLIPFLSPRHLELKVLGKLRIIELNTNLGQGAARNIGASLAVGSYLSFLDQDDEYLPSFYQKCLMLLLENPSLAAVEAGAEYIQEGLIVLDDPDPRYEVAIKSVPWNLLIHRNVFWDCGAFPVGPSFRTIAAGEDIAFKSALRRFFKVLFLFEKCIRHHVRNGSATDRFIKRTQVVDGRIQFLETYQNEADGSLHHAMDEHISRASHQLLSSHKVVRNLKPQDLG